MRRGWCPSLHEPMAAADGLLVRVKPPGGRLPSEAARCLAAAAIRHGNGIIELTSRANLQIRGLPEMGARRFASEMVDMGLASLTPDAERRRNVMAHPLAGDDPAAADDAARLAADIEAMLASDTALAALPPKFGFAVDGGGVLPLSEPADIVVRSDGSAHWIGVGAVEASCDRATTVARVHVLARAAGCRRLQAMIDEEGAVAVLARVGLETTTAAPRANAPARAGFFPYPGRETGAFAFGVPFGQLDAAMLLAVASLADEFGTGVIRMSPWRAFLLGTVRTSNLARLREAAHVSGLIAETADPRLRMAACIGSLGCANGTVAARTDAALLASRATWAGTLHVSGCAKGCAHPAAAELTLVGTDGTYDLVRNGRADAAPQVASLRLDDAILELAG